MVLDDFGLKRLVPGGADHLYDIIDARHERGSILLTSNRSPEEWADWLASPLLASAALDRLLDRAHVVTITGRSYRLTGRQPVPTPELEEPMSDADAA